MNLDQNIVRHAYENTLTACARLSSFATARPTASIDHLINDRQRLLATDDLMTFAINARRLIENTLTQKHFNQVKITVAEKKIKIEKPIWRIINVLVHHVSLNIARFNHDVVDLSDPKNWTDEIFLHKNTKYFPPIVLVRSDVGKPIVFGLWDFMVMFEAEVLSPIVDACSEAGFYLNDIDP
jgi:hypothetical protein